MTELHHTAQRGGFSASGESPRWWVEQAIGGRYHHYRSDEFWAPAINIYECDENYWVVMDLSGVHAEDIDIRAEDGKMHISGVRPTPEMPHAQMCMHLMEIDHGPFARVLDMPPDANDQAIKATYRFGYLRIRIPRKR